MHLSTILLTLILCTMHNLASWQQHDFLRMYISFSSSGWGRGLMPGSGVGGPRPLFCTRQRVLCSPRVPWSSPSATLASLPWLCPRAAWKYTKSQCLVLSWAEIMNVYEEIFSVSRKVFACFLWGIIRGKADISNTTFVWRNNRYCR